MSGVTTCAEDLFARGDALLAASAFGRSGFEGCSLVSFTRLEFEDPRMPTLGGGASEEELFIKIPN